MLIGTNTYARPWVRYEILKSIERGNLVIGIHINDIPGKDQKTKSLGSNPFDYIGLTISGDGKGMTPIEWNGKEWINYSELGTFLIDKQPIANYCKAYCGKGLKLSFLLPVYNWVTDSGYKNFSSWVS